MLHSSVYRQTDRHYRSIYRTTERPRVPNVGVHRARALRIRRHLATVRRDLVANFAKCSTDTSATAPTDAVQRLSRKPACARADPLSTDAATVPAPASVVKSAARLLHSPAPPVLGLPDRHWRQRLSAPRPASVACISAKIHRLIAPLDRPCSLWATLHMSTTLAQVLARETPSCFHYFFNLWRNRK
jgi:hypothetical protein